MVDFFNGYYFMFIILAIIFILVLYFYLRNRSNKTKYLVLQSILFVNLFIHFTKLCFEPYRSQLPISIRKVSFENICAVSTLLFPFVFLVRDNTKKFNKIMHSYMYFIGFLGGFGALLYPTEAFNKNVLTYDCLRFYVCHTILIAVPLLAAILKIYEPDYKLALFIPAAFILIEILIFANELILIAWGLVPKDWIMFFDRDIRNSSLIFGPTSSLDAIFVIILVFVPKIFSKNIFGIIGGIDFYWPVIWLIIPTFIFMPLIYLLISLPFNYKRLGVDFSNWKLNLKRGN